MKCEGLNALIERKVREAAQKAAKKRRAAVSTNTQAQPSEKIAELPRIEARLGTLEELGRRLSQLEDLMRALWGKRVEFQPTDGIDAEGRLWNGGKPYTGFSDKEHRMLKGLWGKARVREDRLAQFVYDDRNLRQGFERLAGVKKRLNKKLATKGCPIEVIQRKSKRSGSLYYRLDLMKSKSGPHRTENLHRQKNERVCAHEAPIRLDTMGRCSVDNGPTAKQQITKQEINHASDCNQAG